MPNIIVGSRVIKFPNNGSDASWSQNIIDFAEAVADQLQAVSSEFDISSRVQILITNTNSGLNISDAIFPNVSVRGFSFNYSIYRVTDSESVAETGFVNGVYNTDTSTWTLEHRFQGPRQSDGQPYHTFAMSGDQLTLSTVALSGVYDNTNSKISYLARTTLVSNI